MYTVEELPVFQNILHKFDKFNWGKIQVFQLERVTLHFNNLITVTEIETDRPAYVQKNLWNQENQCFTEDQGWD